MMLTENMESQLRGNDNVTAGISTFMQKWLWLCLLSPWQCVWQSAWLTVQALVTRHTCLSCRSHVI